MAPAEFSEFSYGFAYTSEVVRLCWGALRAHPTLPSLFDEGRTGGFDVSIGLYGWLYFAQFKRADHLSRSNASQWPEYGAPYYRFDITRRSRSRQHELLLDLEQRSLFHIVEYVAPKFHLNAELSHHFLSAEVVARSTRIFPSKIGPFLDDAQHSVSYTSLGSPTVWSDPSELTPPYNAGSFTDLHEALEGTPPVELGPDTFLEVAQELAQAGELGLADLSWMDDAMGGMSPFGRARALARMLGGELIPLVRASPGE